MRRWYIGIGFAQESSGVTDVFHGSIATDSSSNYVQCRCPAQAVTLLNEYLFVKSIGAKHAVHDVPNRF